jgi:hypothetical protein
MGWKEKSKYTLWAVGVSCGIVAEAEAANSLFENRKTPFERLDLTKNLNKTHHTGIPIWQAVFRATLLDRSLHAQGRLDVGSFFGLASGFLFMLQSINTKGNPGCSQATLSSFRAWAIINELGALPSLCGRCRGRHGCVRC